MKLNKKKKLKILKFPNRFKKKWKFQNICLALAKKKDTNQLKKYLQLKLKIKEMNQN